MCLRNLCFVGEGGWRWGGGGPQGGRQSRVRRRAARSARPSIEARPSIVPARLFHATNPFIFVGTTKKTETFVFFQKNCHWISQSVKNTLKVIFCVEAQDRRDPLRKSHEWNGKLGRKNCFVCLFEDAVNSWYVYTRMTILIRMI